MLNPDQNMIKTYVSIHIWNFEGGLTGSFLSFLDLFRPTPTCSPLLASDIFMFFTWRSNLGFADTVKINVEFISLKSADKSWIKLYIPLLKLVCVSVTEKNLMFSPDYQIGPTAAILLLYPIYKGNCLKYVNFDVFLWLLV